MTATADRGLVVMVVDVVVKLLFFTAMRIVKDTLDGMVPFRCVSNRSRQCRGS